MDAEASQGATGAANESDAGVETITSEEALKQPIHEYLDGLEDINDIKLKVARAAVSKALGQPVDKKAFKNAIQAVINERNGNDDSSESEASSSSSPDAAGTGKSRRGGLARTQVVLSKPLAKFLGVETETRPQIVKKLWEYIREHDLQNPNDKREIRCDDALRELFQRDQVTMFNMNKLLTCHVISQKAWNEGKRTFDTYKLKLKDEVAFPKTAKPSKPKTKSGVKRKRRGGGGGGGFCKVLRISEPLQRFMNEETAARTAVTKKLWEHIRANELQNPDNKREIICDDTLRDLFGQEKVTIFSMNKFIQPHFIKDDE
ncbi:SWI/SNF-related matrix-associated actin-dependent regulator of chromatin subfamily D member 1 [Hondaea fermentalgiana]|uniref:SWI/SNF-related matrix-associated actin-dependent regulator of chromatin subfamily D member 1 n=1 Tax=Hondaea fermentalgiana TaxID=2315210 RepID=A0A2R5GX73_9STRA|nr:SWI/SNF-related matrix-associated actin-dependent regulator of chromatin subfamily D member 1 [Hondaea fermentalgiana]|eukprot:GBG33011.1 SWI/SNF-related matrix-associated actin-dependent regulator of chromatin subfamily D member 1 [Hondaea fermentalgiana]